MSIRAFEQLIGHLLLEAGMIVTTSPEDLARVDYMVIDPFGERIAIEAKGHTYQGTKEDSEHIVQALKPIASRIAKFVLVTPKAPDGKSLNDFVQAFQGMPNDAEWLGIHDFTRLLGLPSEAVSELYDLTGQADTDEQRLSEKETAKLLLNRQFSNEIIEKINDSAEPPESFLKVGERMPVVVVLSDIKNYSLLVKATKPDDLNDAMRKYYRLARTLVWDHGGILDKFIGDAVLAIFGYPEPDPAAQVRAVKFGSELIEMGRTVLDNLSDQINESVETGTRVGIASGEISVLNIGQETIEISFVGDVINLAARLEHASDLNGILIDNLTRVAILKTDETFLKLLTLEERELKATEVKGQLTGIRGWQVPPNVIPYIAKASKK